MSTENKDMDDSFEEMRRYIMVTESLIQAESEFAQPEELIEVVAVQSDERLIEEMNDIVFRLRAFMESADGDIGLGIEMGMQRAADMIENVLNRHKGQGE